MSGRQTRQTGGGIEAAAVADCQSDLLRALRVKVRQAQTALLLLCACQLEAKCLSERRGQVCLASLRAALKPSSRLVLRCGSTSSHLSCSGRSDKCLALWSQSVQCSTCSWPDPAGLPWYTLWRRCSCRGLSGCHGCRSWGSQSCRRYPEAQQAVMGDGGGWGWGARVGLAFRKGLVGLHRECCPAA